MSEPSKKRWPGLLKIVLVTLLLVAASSGGTLYALYARGLIPGNFLNALTASPAQAEMATPPAAESFPAPAPVSAPVPVPDPAEVTSPIFLELDPFTSVLRDAQNRRRVLHVGITLRVESEVERGLFMDYMPEVRDRILSILGEQDPNEVLSLEGRTRLARELRRLLSVRYHPQLPPPCILSVLFTAFVVQ